MASSSKCGKYDVFLSFRGDTRRNFTDHLACTLKTHGFKVFLDENELTRGEPITPELKQAIKDSRLAAIIFSRGYAESRWCLDELVEILNCRTMGQMVLPIFYRVDPSDVRHQTGAFKAAFESHQEQFPDERVQTWRKTLKATADLAGEDFSQTDRYEGRFVQEIVDKIARKLKNTYFDIAPNPIGIDSRVQKIGKYLDNGESDDVRIIGIWGMGGLGKTTVAKAIFNKYQDMFAGASFLANVRERKPVTLQNKLLSDVLRSINIEVSNVDKGTEEIRRRLGNRKVLVIVDDVDSMKQLKELAIKRESFGPGSRIVITTRNKHLLETLKPDKIRHLPAMNKEEALELLSWHAFSEKYPNEEYLEVSREVVEYCEGLPLALEVLGSYLCKRSTSHWEYVLKKWKRSRPYSDIHQNLKISYDGIKDDDVKSMFLDISCFFIGKNKDYVMKILDRYDGDTIMGIKELEEQCLVTVDTEGNLMMHGLIRDTGREIVREKSPENPIKRCRLWDHEDVICVLRTKTRKGKIQGLALDLSGPPNLSFCTDAFKEMHILRLLKLKGVQLTGHCEHLSKLLSKELRWLCWPEFPVEVIPRDFNQTNLVDIDLSHSNIRAWEDSDVPLEKLKFLNLGYCKHLEQSPDFSKIPNLERLILEGCTILPEIHSVVRLINLKYLSLANCNLADHAIPQDLGALYSLEVLDARGNGFNCLPILSRLSKLQTLHLNNCTNLQEIPDLPTNLEILEADECIALEKMPDFSEMSRMRELHLNHSPELTGILGLDKALNSMTRIHMERCTNLTADFKKAILQGWSARGNGGLFLPGNEIPSRFTPVDPLSEIVVPQSFCCEYTLDCQSMPYSSECKEDGNHKAGHCYDSSHENQSRKRLRTDPSVERNAEEETDEIMQEGSSMG
ncbi:unnamed protein product [Malus baccata var. baccata]